MVRRIIALGMGAATLAACGGSGGSGSGSGSVPVVTAPAPGPTPTPTAPPTPAAPPYPTVVQLAGDQQFRTSCASLVFNGTPPQAPPVPTFGSGLTLAYAAATQTWTVSADAAFQPFFGSQPRSYGPADRDPGAPAGVNTWLKTSTGFQERFTLGQPTAAGAIPDYLRGFSLRTPIYGETRPGAPALQYSCLYGVPTRLDDPPRTAAAVTFTRTGFNGVAYAQPTTGGLETYALAGSPVTLTVDLTTYRVSATVKLTGALVSASGTAAQTTDLGTYTGEVTIDEAGFYNGLLRSTDRTVQAASFGGWFFGPQGAEAGFNVAIMAQDAGTERRISAIGNAVALR